LRGATGATVPPWRSCEAVEYATLDWVDWFNNRRLLAQFPQEEEIATVTAGGACDTRACHDAIAARGMAAIIPPRRTARPWKPDTAGARARNEILRASRHLGRALWRNLSGSHCRSRVETKMNCVKLLGQRLMSRNFDRQVAEVQIRVAVRNRFTAPGTRHPGDCGRRITVSGERATAAVS